MDQKKAKKLEGLLRKKEVGNTVALDRAPDKFRVEPNTILDNPLPINWEVNKTWKSCLAMHSARAR